MAFAWAFGLTDWRAAEALGMTENALRLHRRRLGLRKTGRGAPINNQGDGQ